MYKVHVPTEQYGFVEQEIDTDDPNVVKEAYDAIQASFKRQEGISTKDFNAVLDRYLTEGTMEADLYTQMSPEQVTIVQAIKRSIQRRNNKNHKSLK